MKFIEKIKITLMRTFLMMKVGKGNFFKRIDGVVDESKKDIKNNMKGGINKNV